jgi:hypothetical protein
MYFVVRRFMISSQCPCTRDGSRSSGYWGSSGPTRPQLIPLACDRCPPCFPRLGKTRVDLARLQRGAWKFCERKLTTILSKMTQALSAPIASLIPLKPEKQLDRHHPRQKRKRLPRRRTPTCAGMSMDEDARVSGAVPPALEQRRRRLETYQISTLARLAMWALSPVAMTWYPASGALKAYIPAASVFAAAKTL